MFARGVQPCATVKLVDGEGAWEDWEGNGYTLRAHLGFVRYGDMTGDGREEAVVRLGHSAGGTGQFSQLLVYPRSAGGVRLVHLFDPWGIEPDLVVADLRELHGRIG